jgi:hypothetical protein
MYAATALFDSAILVQTLKLKLQLTLAGILASIACLALRMEAVQQH